MRSCTRATLAVLLLGAGCARPEPSAETCARRAECGDLAGLTEAECEAGERARLDRLSGDARATCADATGACLEGASCDDFRACHAAIDRTTCPCPDPSLVFVAPRDGQTITSADDADPSDAQLDFDFVIDAVCLERSEQVQLFLLAPAMSSYGFGAPDARGRAIIRAPLIAGTNRFVARGMTTAVASAEITVSVSP